MCDYSLERQNSRAAVVGDRLVSTGFPGTPTRGFATATDLNTAVCLRPGTELAFDGPIETDGLWPAIVSVIKRSSQSAGRVAVFRQINGTASAMHHDALELENGNIILLTHLRPGQQAVVLQLPVDPDALHHGGQTIDVEPVRVSEVV